MYIQVQINSILILKKPGLNMHDQQKLAVRVSLWSCEKRSTKKDLCAGKCPEFQSKYSITIKNYFVPSVISTTNPGLVFQHTQEWWVCDKEKLHLDLRSSSLCPGNDTMSSCFNKQILWLRQEFSSHLICKLAIINSARFGPGQEEWTQRKKHWTPFYLKSVQTWSKAP